MLIGRALPVAIVASAVWASAAFSQDVPLIDGVGAWNHAQTMRHRDGGDSPARAAQGDNEADGRSRPMVLSPEARQSLVALKPELERRTKEDGAASANRWFEGKVAEAERREGILR